MFMQIDKNNVIACVYIKFNTNAQGLYHQEADHIVFSYLDVFFFVPCNQNGTLILPLPNRNQPTISHMQWQSA